MKPETLEDYFYEELRALYGEEQKLVDALPKMIGDASSGRLRESLQQHLDQTREHVERIEKCFADVGRSPDAKKSTAMKGLIEQGEEAIAGFEQSPLRDAALIGAARRIEDYEIAAYSGAVSTARLLGREHVANLLEQTLGEERQADERLTEVRDLAVGQEALQLGAHQRR